MDIISHQYPLWLLLLQEILVFRAVTSLFHPLDHSILGLQADRPLPHLWTDLTVLL